MLESQYLEIRFVIACTFAISFLILERMVPYAKTGTMRWERWPANIGLTVLNSILLASLRLSPYAFSLVCEANQWGLFHIFGLSPLAAGVLTFLIFDLAIYGQHVFFHYVPILWRLHRVHHTDVHLDVTSAFRFHPVEIMLSMSIKMGLILILGANPLGVLIFEIVLNSGSIFSHANVMIPQRLDTFLQTFVVTPRMHWIHHSIKPKEANTNFGFNLSIWDRIFRTYRIRLPHEADNLRLGVAGIPNLPFLRLLSLPMKKKEHE